MRRRREGPVVLLARDVTEQTIVHGATAAFASARDLSAALESFRAVLEPVVSVAELALCVVAGDGFRRAAASRRPSGLLGAAHSMRLPLAAVGAAAETLAPVVVPSTREGRFALDPPFAEADVASYAVLPIFDRGRVVATLNFGFAEPGVPSPELVGSLVEVTSAVAPSVLTLLALQTQADTIRRLGRRDTLMNEFLALIAHDIRAPVSVIAGFAETLQRRWTELSEEDKLESVDAVVRNARNLRHIVEEALDVALFESGQFTYAPRTFDVAQQIEQTVRDLTGRIDNDRVRITIPDRLPPVHADPDRNWQVLTNLISNAMKFSPPAQPIEVAVRVRGAHLQIEVRDRGIGIEAAELPKLFQKFSRVGRREQPGVGGTGLGLYICKMIVEAQGGRIWAESGPDGGAAFVYTLPVADAAAGGESAA